MDTIPILSTKIREVWTTDERRLLDRCAKLFNMHGDKFLLVCGSPVCPDPPMRLHADQGAPGGMILECGCRRRVFTRSC